MSEAATHSKRFGEARQKVVGNLKQKGLEAVASTLETTTAQRIANEDFIAGLRTSFPKAESELIAIHETAKEYQKKGVESYNPYEFFEDMPNGGKKFQPRWLAKDIMDDYRFLWVRELEKLYVYKNDYWKPQGIRIVEEECNKRLEDEHRATRAREVKEIIKTETSISRYDFTPPDYKINFQNGVYNLEKGELEEHTPEDYFTQKIPWNYDPDAVSPAINDFLEDITHTEEDMETLIEAAGYCMLPNIPISKAFILVGEGSNGKTQFLNILKEMIGKENYKEEDLQQLEETRFGTQSLYQKLALFSDDLPSKALQSANTFKSLVGGGEVRAEYKGGAHFQFENYATPVFACNDIPHSQDDSDGFYRRWMIVNFPYKFKNNPSEDNAYEKSKKPENELEKEILDEDEIKGFINEALVHLELVLDQGQFTHDMDVEDLRRLWNAYSDPVNEFIEKYVEQGITKNEAERKSDNNETLTSFDFDYILKDDLHDLICKYCESRNTRPPTKQNLTKRLQQKNLYFTNTRSVRPSEDNSQVQIYRGIRFSNDFWAELKSLQGLQGFRSIPRVRVCENYIDEVSSRYATPASFSDNEEENGKNLKGKVESVFSEISDGESVSYQDLIDACEDEHGFSEDDVIEVIDHKKHEGEWYSPKPNRVDEI